MDPNLVIFASIFIFFVFAILLLMAIKKSKGVFFKENEKPNKVITLGIPIILAIIVIALIIYAIMPQPGPWNMGNDPVRASSDLVKSNYDKYSEYTTSQEVLFNASASSLNLKSIATQSKNISSTQLCIAKGDFTGSDSEFKFKETGSGGNVVLAYVGGSQKKATIGIICDDAKSLSNDLQSQGIEAGEMQCGDGGTSFPNKNETFCILILKNA